MLFDNLLSRADDSTLQTLLGGSTLRLLRLLDPNIVTLSGMRRVLLNLHTPEDLLTDTETRALLLDLLRPNEAHRLAEILSIVISSDVYSELRSLRIRRGSERERSLFDFFELRPPSYKEQREQIAPMHLAEAEIPLFKHQRDAARKVRKALNTEPHRVLLHMPTGAGKTRTAMHIIADHLREFEPTLVIWLAYSEELCEQAASEFERVWQRLGDRHLQIHRFWGNRDLNLDLARDGIIIASLTKIYRSAMHKLAVLGILSARCSLVVIDEAHQAVADTYQLVLDTLVTQGRRAALLGLSATPGRTWDNVDADASLAAFFARRKVTLQIEGYSSPIEYLVAEGYLANVSYRSLLYNNGTSLSVVDLRRIERELDIPKDILQSLAEDEQRNLAIVIEAERLIAKHSRIIIFAASVQHARLLTAVLSARGHQTSVVTGDTSPDERARQIAYYKELNDEPRILCNFGVLTTGFDAPLTSAALIGRPTRSLVLYSQMVGRAIRGPRVGGNVSAEIVTVVDTQLPGFGDVTEAFSNWEDVWSTL